MATLDRSWDVIVIGAGLGGLSAAAHLARAGQRVLVLEQHVFSGGYAHDFPRKVPGTDIVYHFDVALHQTGDLDPGRPMHRMLAGLGVLERLKLHRFDVVYRTRGPEHDLRVPAHADAYEELLCSTYPDEAEGVRSLFARLRAIDRPAEQGGPSEEAMATMPLSLQQLMDEHVSDPRVQSIFATLWGYVGLLPQDCSAFLYARMWATFHLGGTYYIAGGGRALSDAFVAVIEEHGGKVVVRRPVEAIRTAGGRVVGVTTRRHGDFDAPVVISNAAAPLTFHTLLDHPDLATADLERVDSLPLSLSIHQAYVGLRGDAATLGLEDRVDFVNPSYDFEDEARALAEGDYRRQGYLLGNHNLADPEHHPPGRSIVHVSTMTEGTGWLDLEESEYRERKAELEDYLIGRLEEEIPDVRERIEICETGTPHTMRRYSQNPGGAIYGYAHGPTSHSIFRPAPRTSVPGLYLAGAWTFPAAGFSGTMGSGRHTAKLVMEDVAGAQEAGALR